MATAAKKGSWFDVIGKVGGVIGAVTGVGTLIGWIGSADGDTLRSLLFISGGVFIACALIAFFDAAARGTESWWTAVWFTIVCGVGLVWWTELLLGLGGIAAIAFALLYALIYAVGFLLERGDSAQAPDTKD